MPVRCQVISWTNGDLLSIGPRGVKIQWMLNQQNWADLSTAKCRLFRLLKNFKWMNRYFLILVLVYWYIYIIGLHSVLYTDIISRMMLGRTDSISNSESIFKKKLKMEFKYTHCLLIQTGCEERLNHIYIRADSTCRVAPSQWETALHCNDVCHYSGASLESAL